LVNMRRAPDTRTSLIPRLADQTNLLRRYTFAGVTDLNDILTQ